MAKLKKKCDQANKLITGLADEKKRWKEDANNFAELKKRLVGDVSVATAFISYCGPFNSEFRAMLIREYFTNDLKKHNIPVNVTLDLINFLVDDATVGEWNL